MMICKYRASIKGNNVFMREYEIDSNMRLFKLHEFLLSDLGFSPDQITLFSTLDAKGNVLRRFGFFDLGDGTMDKISVGDTLSAGEEILRYTYNVHLKLSLILTYCGEGKYDSHRSYPRVTAEKGHNPNQFSAVYEDYSKYLHFAADEENEKIDEENLPEGEERINGENSQEREEGF